MWTGIKSFQRTIGTYFRSDRLTNLHLELTTRCKLACRRCDRTFVLKNHHYRNSHPYMYQGPLVNSKDEFSTRSDMSLETIRRLVPKEARFKVFISGNYGDPLYHPDIISILEYLIYETKVKKVNMTTNGSGMNEDFWLSFRERVGRDQNISRKRFHLTLSIDGLEDTNHIYRRGAKWSSIVRGVELLRDYISMSWKFIVFRHNQHQIQNAQLIYKKMGFESISFVESNRYSWFWAHGDPEVDLDKEGFLKSGDPLKPSINIKEKIYETS